MQNHSSVRSALRVAIPAVFIAAPLAAFATALLGLGPASATAASTLGADTLEVAREAETQEVARGEGPVFRVPIEGVIELGLAPFVERSLQEAAAAEAAAVILDVDTPGGRVDAAERIAAAIADSEVPVYAYVNRAAISAGALISLAADGIYMRPGSRIGGATPVDGAGQTAPEKIVSVMRSTMRSLAEARGLDPAVAEAMVDPEIEIEGVVAAGQLLTLTYSEAVGLGYATEVADWNELMEALGTTDREVVEQTANWAERTVRFLTHPVVAPFLLSLGFLGLLVEIKSPGVGLAGGAGVLALALFFGSHLIIGLAGLEGLIVFGVGVVFVLVEALVLPGLGVFGILGGLAILAGIYMSLIGDIPTVTDYSRAAMTLAMTLTLVMASSWFLVRRMPSNRRLTRLGIFLGEETHRDTGYTSSVRRDELRGTLGVAVTDLRPAGTGLFGEERLDVVSEQSWIEAGTPIEIVASEGYRHVVRIAPDREISPGHPGPESG